MHLRESNCIFHYVDETDWYLWLCEIKWLRCSLKFKHYVHIWIIYFRNIMNLDSDNIRMQVLLIQMERLQLIQYYETLDNFIDVY